MIERPFIVGDTNLAISRFLSRKSIAAQAFRITHRNFIPLYSDETIAELEEVLLRPKFNRHGTYDEKRRFIRLISKVSEHIKHVPPVSICRDPKDDKFIALALAGGASIIVTGDLDLLELDPFRDIRILTPRNLVDRYTAHTE